MKKLLVCDLDNTLYDWVSYFVVSFYSMVDEVVRITGCEREKLLDDFRDVHRFHHDSEHPFSLLETDTVRRIYLGKSSEEISILLDSAFYAFNSSRKKSLQLYPGVKETLGYLRERDIKIVAHTESKLYATIDRLSRLELFHYFDRIYCRERTKVSHPVPNKTWGFYENFPNEKVVELLNHQRKPSQEVLLEICAREGVAACESAYIGDSMARDMLMAKRAGVTAIWASYGAQHNAEDYEKLVRISHWTKEDVEREKELSKAASSIVPDAIAKKSFDEIVDIIF